MAENNNENQDRANYPNYPGDLDYIIEIIGLESAMKMVGEIGGTFLRPKADHDLLVRMIGEAKAGELLKENGREWLRVPKCDRQTRMIRDEQIRALYDTGEYTALSLARKFHLTDRRIFDILGQASAPRHVQTAFFLMR